MSFLLSCLVLWPAAGEQKELKEYPRADLLVEAAQLAKPEFTRRIVILDARSRKAYDTGTIPDAIWVDHQDWQKTFAATQAPKVWATKIQNVGISLKTPVIIFDNSLNKDAARIWWILRYWGVEDVRLLNGGWRAWTLGNHPISREPTSAAAIGSARFDVHTSRLTTKKQLVDQLNNKNLQILDARSEGEFCGDTKFAKRGGAIPGAKHLEWSEALDPKTGRFKSPAQLQKLLRDAGIDLNKRSVTYCQSGGRAAVLAFTLELMGARDVSNYYRSWSEWGNDPDAPLELPKKK
jgi:thiosulfate/3-mercaptopyruvate sulfurtransferase